MAGWIYENDEDTLDQWLVRDGDSDNADVVATVPKTGAEDYDSEVVWPRAAMISAAPEMLAALEEVLAQGFVQCNCGEPCEGTCTFGICLRAVTKARAVSVLVETKRRSWRQWFKILLGTR